MMGKSSQRALVKNLLVSVFFNTKYPIVRLKFPEVQAQMHRQLRTEAADWIEANILLAASAQAQADSNADYCNAWARLTFESFPEMTYQQSNWKKANWQAGGEWYPAATGLRSMCLDLVEGSKPPQPKIPEKDEGFFAWINFLRQKAETTFTKPSRQIS
jgi:hypothetical protein